MTLLSILRRPRHDVLRERGGLRQDRGEGAKARRQEHSGHGEEQECE